MNHYWIKSNKHSELKQRTVSENDKVQKNSQESNLFRRVNSKPRRRSNELGEGEQK